MLLVLALRSDPETVYQRALAVFTPDELSEAFAATRGVASPTQLRQFMKRDGRDLLAPSAALPRDGRRSRSSAGASAGWPWPWGCPGDRCSPPWAASRLLLPGAEPANPGSAGVHRKRTPVSCRRRPYRPPRSSRALVASLGLELRRWRHPQRRWLVSGLDSDRAGRAVTVTLTSSCRCDERPAGPTDQPGTVRYEKPISLRRGSPTSAPTSFQAAARPTSSPSLRRGQHACDHGRFGALLRAARGARRLPARTRELDALWSRRALSELTGRSSLQSHNGT